MNIDELVKEIPVSVHPAAACFPMMSHAELEDLAKDIETNGLQEPVKF